MEKEAASTPRVWTPVFVLTIVITFFAFVSGQGLNTGMSVYVEHIGGTTTFAGLLMAVFSASAAVSRIVVGPVIDGRGRRIVMVAGSLVLAAGILLPGLAPNEATLVVGRLLQGVGFAAATTAASTAASDTLPNERMAEGISFYGLGQALATSVGPAFALFLIDTDPAENLFLVLSAVALVTAALSVACAYERRPDMLQPQAVYRLEHATSSARLRSSESARKGSKAVVGATSADEPASNGRAASEPGASMPEADASRAVDASAGENVASFPSSDGPIAGASASEGALAESCSSADVPNAAKPAVPAPRGLRAVFEPRALPGAIPMLFMSAAFGFAVSFAGLYGESLGVANAGVFYTCSAVSMLAIRFASKPLMEALPPIRTFAIAAACGIVAFALLLAAGGNELLFYAAGVFYGVCLGISLPLNQSVAVKNTPPERWGATNALYLLASDVGIGGASVVWGAVHDAFGFPFTICCVMACVVVSYLLALAVYPPEAKGRV